MQYQITDQAAIEFSSAFYESLADGLPVDAAVTEARVAVSMDSMLEWGTPVLYMRSPDGRLFDISIPAAHDHSTPEIADRQAAGIEREGPGSNQDHHERRKETQQELSMNISITESNVDRIQRLRTLEGHESVVRSVAFSPDGKLLGSASMDRTVRLWRVEDGKLVHTLEGFEISVHDVAFSPDGKTLATAGSYEVRLWRVEDGRLVRRLKHKMLVDNVAFSPDGQLVGSPSIDGTVRLWRVEDGKLVQTLMRHSGEVQSVAFSPDGELLASSSADDTVNLWQVTGEDATLLRSFEGYGGEHTLAFSPNGEILVSVGPHPQYMVNLWKVKDGTLLRSVEMHSTIVTFSPDGRLLASGAIELWGIE